MYNPAKCSRARCGSGREDTVKSTDTDLQKGSGPEELMKALDEARVPRLNPILTLLVLQLLGLAWLFLVSKALGG